MAVFVDYGLKDSGKTIADAPDMGPKLKEMTEDTGGSPLLARAPLLLQKSLLFPYGDGLVFEHQVRIMNLLTRAAWESRIALVENHSLTQPARAALNELADSLLFVGEAPLEGEIAGTSGFEEAFASRGPRDREGRSLRDLSLRGRLLRYPCSYMVYSKAFEALPAEAQAAVYRRMWKALSARPAADRDAIVEILRETKSGLPDYFRARKLETSTTRGMKRPRG